MDTFDVESEMQNLKNKLEELSSYYENKIFGLECRVDDLEREMSNSQHNTDMIKIDIHQLETTVATLENTYE